VDKKNRAILFDMDGVLVDSMGTHVNAWHRACSSLGIEISEDELYRREGEKPEKSARDFIKGAGMMTTKARVRTLLEAAREEFYRQPKPKMFPGAEESAVTLAEAGFKIGVVTGSRRVWMDQVIPDSIRKAAGTLICGDDVLHGKPNPEPYLKAILALGVKPQETVVVENAPFGIESAKSAGAYVIAVRSYLGDQDLVQADELIDDVRELPAIFGLV
jgi:HAD superfamily hydrolase (TIGR01509 family)